uniref:Uncharacterized protein n=1 Tax=Oryza sativa subsp. japonica TaxID=39947 RepID=Q6K389_ORYSJ|nr:hypothetical protein [Oryza sativa Japonica Group]BAD22429.1 hypothetical protein [Oryza sativa Japonica Group]
MAAVSPAAAVLGSRRLCWPLAQAAARQRKGRGRAAAAARVAPPESPDAGGDAGDSLNCQGLKLRLPNFSNKNYRFLLSRLRTMTYHIHLQAAFKLSQDIEKSALGSTINNGKQKVHKGTHNT